MRRLSALLADRHRRVVALGTTLFLAASALGWVWLVVNLRVGDWHTILHPTEHSGERVVLSLWSVNSLDGAGAYSLVKSGFEVEVVGPTAGLRLGDSVTVEVDIAADGSMSQRWLEPHPDRVAKEWAGYLALGFLVLFLPLAFRVRHRRVVPRG